MPPERNWAQLEKAGAQHGTTRVARCRATLTPAASYREACLVFGWVPLKWPLPPLHICGGAPGSLLLPRASHWQARAGRQAWAASVPTSGLGKGWADREGTAASEERNGWRGREGKRYFLNKSPRVKAYGLCTAAEAGAVTRWVIKEMPAPVWARFLFLRSGSTLISVALCSSSSSHTPGEGCLSQKGRHLPSKRGGKAKPKGEGSGHGVCSGISPLSPHIGHSPLSKPSPPRPSPGDSLTHGRQRGKIIFTRANSKLSFAGESSYLSSQTINGN